MTDIIVIGAGAAGMTAALYALRSGRSVLILESEAVGGQIAQSPRVENFPSVKQIAGTEFADKLFEQIMDLGVEFELEKVNHIEKIDNFFRVHTDYGAHEAKAVIIAAGVKHKHLPNFKREEELVGKGVSYCAVCDGAFYKGEEVALVGDANSALQYTLLLSTYCPKVTVLTLFDKFFADAFLIKAVKEKQNIQWIPEVVVTDVTGEREVEGVVYKTKEGVLHTIPAKALFIAIGQVPDNKIYTNLVTLDKEGYIQADESCKTQCEGVFVAGDCRTKKIRQLTTATADGAVAALAACSYIDSL